MSTSPQPFFVRGPSPLARLTAFGLLALVLMFVDSRYRALDSVRSVIATIVHPMQQAALVPLHAWRGISSWFESRNALQMENQSLRSAALANAQVVQGYQTLSAENQKLRAMLSLSERTQVKGTGADVIQAGRDAFAQRLFIDRGTRHGIGDGQAVMDSTGVIGQVARAHPLVSEVILITEKDHAIPVRNERTGVRYVMFGQGGEQLPELRFVSSQADIQVGDVLSTSGLDRIYPSALAVATVASITKEPGQPFMRIRCVPLAGVHSSRQVLVVAATEQPPEVPPPPAPIAEKAKGAKRTGAKQ
jgi:rod shape-determining protein MreC